MDEPDLLLLGCGNMGAALAAGFLARSPDARILAIDPDPDRARALLPASPGVAVKADLTAAAEIRPGLTVVAVKPQALLATLPPLAALAAARGLVVSVVAGATVAALRRNLPEARIVRTMPNTPALVGAGVTALWADAAVTDEDRRRCDALFGAVGATHWLDVEAALDAVTAVSGSGPAYVFAVVEALACAGTALGLPTGLAEALARATLAGASAMLAVPGSDPAKLKAAVRSPAGTTDAALRVLEEDDALGDLMARAVRAAHRRAAELAAGLS